jgi:N-acyl-D-aspartate/D-glutamate deacylase
MGQIKFPCRASVVTLPLGLLSTQQNETITLSEALRKMTLMPAQRLELIAPSAAQKGRMQLGMDAGITIFNLDTILDQATFEEGPKFSTGIEFVLVSSTVVVDGGETVGNVYRGEPVVRKHHE